MGNRKNRNSTSKYKFKGNRYTNKNNTNDIDKNIKSAPTASEIKLQNDSKISSTVENEDKNSDTLRTIGKGHSAARKLCSAINVNFPSKRPAFRFLEKKLEHVSNKVVCKIMNEAAAEVHKKNNFDEVIQCSVSVNGTWQRRGHLSLNGCVSVISIDNARDLSVCLDLGHSIRGIDLARPEADHEAGRHPGVRPNVDRHPQPPLQRRVLRSQRGESRVGTPFSQASLMKLVLPTPCPKCTNDTSRGWWMNAAEKRAPLPLSSLTADEWTRHRTQWTGTGHWTSIGFLVTEDQIPFKCIF
ncbi:uncharacterized protein TNIN_259681 [Trichonephila inaurata madagascariensis]|uniref:Mutator-like transposase domain-containing protein n=1 Tax=Trichonephila inaurata madagascariensis TaxID=2747483 RepID=A0A8X6WVG4_9ARAC|nr:uncharacterized protein TNIN_259681 [Trichonephila inaurata madagascariensis]